jgi:hypothetical protein
MLFAPLDDGIKFPHNNRVEQRPDDELATTTTVDDE